MSVRDIARHVRQTTGVDLSPDTISRVTDTALEAMREWQTRPLDSSYPVIYTTTCSRRLAYLRITLSNSK
jgi:putative transposase